MSKTMDPGIYARIKGLADEQGLTMVRLGQLIGASSGNVSDWKNGRSSPNTEKICKIADYFHVTTDYLLGRETKVDLPTEDAMELMKIYNRLDRAGRAIVLGEAYRQKLRCGVETEA